MISDAVLRSAMASKLAYARNTNLVATFPIKKQLLSDEDKFRVIHSPSTSAHAYIWSTGKTSHLISFRGSHNAFEIVKYIDSRQIPFSFCEHHVKVHKRIYEMFFSLEPMITNELFVNGNFASKQSITFCGHSLGGSLAMFASAYYSHMTNMNHNITCHTFGAPKLGDANFVEWFRTYVKDSVNVYNKSDVVPLFPFGESFVNDASITICLQRTTNNAIEDHDLDTYITNIRNDMHLQRTMHSTFVDNPSK